MLGLVCLNNYLPAIVRKINGFYSHSLITELYYLCIVILFYSLMDSEYCMRSWGIVMFDV